MTVNHAISDAIWLKKLYNQKLAEQADFNNDRKESARLWGINEALNWVIDLLEISNNDIQYDFVKMTNTIYENATKNDNDKED